MIQAQNLTKFYGTKAALRDVSFEIERGEIVGFLGPNGAGKTTTMRILTGFIPPTGGSARIAGFDCLTESLEVRKRIGYMPETVPLYPEMAVWDYLEFFAKVRGLADRDRAIARVMDTCGIAEVAHRPTGELSKGYRQRVGLAQALLHEPEVLILDEPTIGLDPTQIVEVRHLIRRLAQNSTVLLSTHILSEVEAICDRVIILLNGQIRADSRLADLEASGDVLLVLQEGAPDATADLRALQGVRSVETTPTADGLTYRVRGSDGADLRPAIYNLARERGWPLKELRRDVRTLETVFNELVTSTAMR